MIIMKFRMWHKPTRQFTSHYIYHDADGHERWSNILCICPNAVLVREEFGSGGVSTVDDSEYIVSYSSGLTDKNDKEIYEGDILLVKSDGVRDFKCEVKYGEFLLDDNQDGSYTILGWYILHKQWKEVWPLSDLQDICGDFYELEVVGNIYEQ